MTPQRDHRIDLRSDTVTQPDEEMRRAMAEAEVGDDVYGEDPTVRLLEEESAAAVGMEAALFVPSGTMGNQIALHLHASPGEQVICDAASHVLLYEMGAMAALSGLLPRTIPSPGGLLDPVAVEAAVVKDVAFHARTGVITVENTHNMGGGTWSASWTWRGGTACPRIATVPASSTPRSPWAPRRPLWRQASTR
jgi:threonine aldolase